MRWIALAMFLLLLPATALVAALPDAYEPDNSWSASHNIPTNGSRQQHDFHVSGDVDYVNFMAVAGIQYVIETFNLTSASITDTELTLYSTNGVTQLDYIDDIETNIVRTSRLVFNPASNGTYFVKVSEYNDNSGGIYEISITGFGRLIPSILSPSANSNVVKNTAFDFTSSVTCIGASCYNITATLDPEEAEENEEKKGQKKEKIEDEVMRALEESGAVNVIVILEKESGKDKTEKNIENGRRVASEIGGGLQVKHIYSSFAGFSGTIDSSAIYRLASNKKVRAVYLDGEVHASLTSSVPLIKANQVWPMQVNGINVTGIGQTICIIDTGIDYSHADFGSCNITDNINNGNCPKVVGGYDFINHDSDPKDDNGHGSHVAGIAASMNATYRGVAPYANIVAIKSLNAAGIGTDSEVIAGIDWCVANATRLNISVISMSLGDNAHKHNFHCAYDSMTDAIDAAKEAGISVVVAAGNDYWSDGLNSPACVESAISVGAVNDADSISYNRAQVLDVLSPGISVTATNYLGGHTALSGTSMSTPHVAGAVALLQQYSRLKHNRSLTVEEIRHILRYNGKWLYDSGSKQEFPRIDAYASVNAKGVIPTTAGAKPFYSLTANPHNASCLTQLNEGESCNTTWQVVPTGDTNSTYTFFVVYEMDYKRNLTATVNLTIVTSPSIILNQPADASYLANNSVTFNCSASNEFGLSNISLWGNFNGTWMANAIANISGTSNTSAWQLNIYDGSYAWDCRACNSLGNCAFSSANYSLVIDAANPVINALNYSSLVELGYSQYIQANATNGNMDYCNLSYSSLNITMQNDTFEHFYYNFTPETSGSIEFVVYAYDKAGNYGLANGSFIVNDSTDEPYILSVSKSSSSVAYGSRQTITVLAYDKLPLTVLLNHNGTNVTMSNVSSYNFTYSWNTSQCGTVSYTIHANNSEYGAVSTGSFSTTNCCGNNICESGESCSSCANDCGQCQSSSASSSGGGESAAPKVSNSETVVVNAASPEKPIEASISNPLIPIKEVKIEVLKEIKQAKVTVTVVEKAPAEALPSVNVYNYIEIKAENVKQEDIKRASIEFSVNNSWLTANNIAKEKVALFRYNNGWKEQATAYLRREGNIHYYSADVEGFSYFAIGEKKEEEQPVVQEKGEAPKQEGKLVTAMAVREEPASEEKLNSNVIEIIAITLFYIAGIAYLIIAKKRADKIKIRRR